jgi:hypothetical protein
MIRGVGKGALRAVPTMTSQGSFGGHASLYPSYDPTNLKILIPEYDE